MSTGEHSTIAFDVLLRGESGNVDIAPANLEKLRPPAESIERCFRWLSEQGITCHRTEFGLACEAKIELFENLFGVQVTTRSEGAEPPVHEINSELKIPTEIEKLVAQITVARPPTYFGS